MKLGLVVQEEIPLKKKFTDRLSEAPFIDLSCFSKIVIKLKCRYISSVKRKLLLILLISTLCL